MTKMRYEELLPHEFEAALRQCPVAWVPVGTLEYHGPHLAVGNDAIKAEGILARACALAGGVLVPTLYWGTGGGHLDYPTTIMVRREVLDALLDDVLAGLVKVGFRAIVLLTGHYPREQVEAVKEAAARLLQAHPHVRIWAGPEYEAFPQEYRGDHAARWETSFLMALRPELVQMERLVGATDEDAPDATRTLDEMNAPGPLHGILGQNPARHADRDAGEETVQGIVAYLAEWAQGALGSL
jgi:creatinine amidohydrolase